MRFCGKGNCPALEYPPGFAYRLVIRHRIIAGWRQPLYSRPNQSRSPGIWQVDDYELRGITLDITGRANGIPMLMSDSLRALRCMSLLGGVLSNGDFFH